MPTALHGHAFTCEGAVFRADMATQSSGHATQRLFVEVIF